MTQGNKDGDYVREHSYLASKAVTAWKKNLEMQRT